MRPGSKKVSVALLNLSEETQTFKKGTVIVTVCTANLVPPKLASKYVNKNNSNNQNQQPTQEHIDKSEQWDIDTQNKLKQVFRYHHHIFCIG